MSNSKFGRFTYGAETVLISLSSSTRFDELCSQLSLRFRKLKVGQFVLRYSLTDCPNCFLESDDDLCLMLEIFQIMNSPYIEIQILDVGSSSSTCSVDSEHFSDVVKHALDIRHHHDEESDVSSDDSNFEDDNNMIIGNFVSNNKRKYMSSEWDTYIFRTGQCFIGGAVEFRDKLCKFAVERGFEFRYLKNDKSRVTAACVKKNSDGCEWYVHASICKSNGYFYLNKLINEHTCTGVIRHHNHKRLGANVVSTIVSNKVRSDPLIKPKEIVKYLKQDYGFDIRYHIAYRGKEAANRILHGNEGKAYSQLAWYIESLKRTNPGSHCILESADGRFRRLFIAYGACISGFKWCRPMLFVDGTFIKNKYKGILLGACAKTGNKGMLFPYSCHGNTFDI